MDLKKLWDEDSEKAQELHSIASLLYSDGHYIIYDKYVFEMSDEEKAGKLIDTNGCIISDDVWHMAPMMTPTSDGKNIDGWVIIDSDAKNRLCKTETQFKSNFNSNYRKIGNTVENEDIINRLLTVNPRVRVISPNGEIEYASIINRDKGMKALKYRSCVYFKVNNGGSEYFFLRTA